MMSSDRTSSILLVLLSVASVASAASVASVPISPISPPLSHCCSPTHGCGASAVCLDPASHSFCTSSAANCVGKCKHVWCGNGTAGANLTVDTRKPIGNVSENYVSWTFDLYNLHSSGSGGWNLTNPSFIAAAKAFAPAHIRLGGTAADNVTYDMQGQVGRAGAVGIPSGTLSKAKWDELCGFASKAGWTIIFGLNALHGVSSSHAVWDSSNAKELLTYTKRAGCPVVGWECGNEPNLKNKGIFVETPTFVATNFNALRALAVSVYGSVGGGTAASPWIVGPDVTKGGFGFMTSFLSEVDVVPDVATWHHYYTAGTGHKVIVSDYLSPSFLDGYVASARQAQKLLADCPACVSKRTRLWMGETSGAGGACDGAKNVTGKFVGVFWNADKLGAAAATGHSVVCKQQYANDAQWTPPTAVGLSVIDVTPEWWLSLIWKRLMLGAGTEVFQVASTAGQGSTVRAYAQGNAQTGDIGVVIINLGATNASVPIVVSSAALPSGVSGFSTFSEYALTAHPVPSDMQATRAALNGVELQLQPGGAPPPLPPPRSVAGHVVSAPPFSVVFAVFKVAGASSS